MWMLHGFVARDAASDGALQALPQLAPGAPICALPAGDLALVASDVSAAPFARAGALDAMIEKPETAAALAMAHNQLLCKLVETSDVLPVRFGSAMPACDDLENRLTALAEDAAARFDAVRGAAEFAFRLVSPQREDRATPSSASPASGRDYLAARLRSRRRRDGRAEETTALTRRLEAAATEIARAVVRRPVQQNAGAGAATRRLLDLALLIDRSKVEAFAAMVERSALEAQTMSLAVEAVGPWPPFHFAGPKDEDAAAASALS